MLPKAPFSGSLALTTMIKMAMRVTLVVLATVLLSWWHIGSKLTDQAQDALFKYITERGQKESFIFELAEANQKLFKEAFLQQWSIRQQHPIGDRFQQLFEPRTDGTTRLIAETFEGHLQANGLSSYHISGYIGPNAPIDDESFQQRLILGYDLLDKYGHAWSPSFTNTYVNMVENAIIIHWPGVPWGSDAPADLNIGEEEWGYVASPEHNPERRTVWTGLFYDSTSDQWMSSCKTPIDIDGEYMLDVGHDILLNSLFERVLNDRLEGSYNLILRRDGRLIAHPEKLEGLRASKEGLYIQQLEDSQLAAIAYQLRSVDDQPQVLFNKTVDSFLAVTTLKGPDWLFVTVYPKQLISSIALDTAKYIGLIGLISLLLEMSLLYWVLHKNVIVGIKQISHASRVVAMPETGAITTEQLPLPRERNDEVGELAHNFSTMAQKIDSYTRNLEEVVAERTNELLQLSITDPLTSLLNRRGMYEKLEQDFNRLSHSPKGQHCLSLLLVDIDHFKRINDNYGHSVGDQVIGHVAHCLKTQLRNYDSCSRWGGEEYLACLYDCDATNLSAIAEKIRQRVQEPIMIDDHRFSITVSLGGHTITSAAIDQKVSINNVINYADIALYTAKQDGRNRYCVYSPL